MEYFVTDFKRCLIAIIIFLVLFVIDFVFGLCKGIFIEGISSAKLRMSVPKFVGYFGMILMCILLDTLIVTSTDITYAPIGLISCVCFCIIEVSSIIENAKELGIHIPPIITNTAGYIKSKLFNDKEQKGGDETVSFDNWVNRYIGKKTDYDGKYGVQCVDLIDCYVDRVLGLKKGFWGNAKYWWTSRKTSRWLKENFEFITPSYKNGELKRGDIGIRTSGRYGHIFIVSGLAQKGKLKYYDQNASGNGDKMTLREKPYTSEYINGILRPKNQSNLKSDKSFPNYSQNQEYALKGVRGVYADKNAKTRKKVKALTADGRKNATSAKADNNAYLKNGTEITVLEVFKDTKRKKVMVRCPSGWITAYNDNTDWLKRC